MLQWHACSFPLAGVKSQLQHCIIGSANFAIPLTATTDQKLDLTVSAIQTRQSLSDPTFLSQYLMVGPQAGESRYFDVICGAGGRGWGLALLLQHVLLLISFYGFLSSFCSPYHGKSASMETNFAVMHTCLFSGYPGLLPHYRLRIYNGLSRVSSSEALQVKQNSAHSLNQLLIANVQDVGVYCYDLSCSHSLCYCIEQGDLENRSGGGNGTHCWRDWRSVYLIPYESNIDQLNRLWMDWLGSITWQFLLWRASNA